MMELDLEYFLHNTIIIYKSIIFVRDTVEIINILDCRHFKTYESLAAQALDV